MIVDIILDTLEARGMAAIVEGNNLVIRPSELLTDADRVAILDHKAELLELLRREDLSTKQTPVSSGHAARTFDVGAAYNPALAYASANRRFRLGEIDSEQRDYLQSVALGREKKLSEFSQNTLALDRDLQ